MNDISPGLRARVLLEKHGFQTAHALGQNFLLDENLLTHLIDLAGVTGEDEVRRYLGKTFTTIFEQLIEIEAEGIPASPEDKRLIARLLRNATTGFLVEWLESGMKLPIEQTVRRLDFLFTDLVREALKRSAADIAAE